MANSAQITAHVQAQPNPREAEYDIYKRSRYFIAQRPATPDFTETMDGYYLGRMVVPGPMADSRFSTLLDINDFDIVTSQLHIRFIDNHTTDGADEDVRRALYTVMTDEEADAYEAALCRQYPHRCRQHDNNTDDS